MNNSTWPANLVLSCKKKINFTISPDIIRAQRHFELLKYMKIWDNYTNFSCAYFFFFYVVILLSRARAIGDLVAKVSIYFFIWTIPHNYVIRNRVIRQRSYLTSWKKTISRRVNFASRRKNISYNVKTSKLRSLQFLKSSNDSY